MPVSTTEKARCLVFWPITRLSWKKYKSFIRDIPGINGLKFIEYQPKVTSSKSWGDFIHGLYQSHCISDNVDKPSVLRKKINKKIESEFLGGVSEKDRTVMVAFYSLEDDCHEKIIDCVSQVCEHSKERIQVNIEVKKKRKHCYYQNSIKDIVRTFFKEDTNMPSHCRGSHYGRKRIAHAPESSQGCLDIINFLKNNSEIIDEN